MNCFTLFHMFYRTEFILQVFPDNAIKREILGLKVKCQNHGEGCTWTGELSEAIVIDFLFVVIQVSCQQIKNHSAKHNSDIL